MTAINVDGLVALKQYVESLWSRLFHKGTETRCSIFTTSFDPALSKVSIVQIVLNKMTILLPPLHFK